MNIVILAINGILFAHYVNIVLIKNNVSLLNEIFALLQTNHITVLQDCCIIRLANVLKIKLNFLDILACKFIC